MHHEVQPTPILLGRFRDQPAHCWLRKTIVFVAERLLDVRYRRLPSPWDLADRIALASNQGYGAVILLEGCE